MEIWLTIISNGLVYGLLLFLMASGLTLILSLMGVLNFAHAAFFMIGAYLGFSIGQVAGFWWALILAPLGLAILGAATEYWGLRPLQRHGRHHGHGPELLFTFALTFLLQEAVILIWGRLPVDTPVPDYLQSHLQLGSQFSIQIYKLLLVAISATALVGLWVFLTRSRFGLLVEAARSNPDMVSALGHDTGRIHNLVFALGTGLAGLAGAAGGPILVTEPGMAASLGAILFVIIVTGGLGSLTGAFWASMAVGFVQHGAIALDISLSDIAAGLDIATPSAQWDLNLGRMAGLLPYLLLIIILAIRPSGLSGRQEDLS